MLTNEDIDIRLAEISKEVMGLMDCTPSRKNRAAWDQRVADLYDEWGRLRKLQQEISNDGE